MLFAWKANSCNLMIALMHQKEANKNGADINCYLADCGGAILTIMVSWGGRESLPIQHGILYLTKCDYPQLSGVYKGRRPAN